MSMTTTIAIELDGLVAETEKYLTSDEILVLLTAAADAALSTDRYEDYLQAVHDSVFDHELMELCDDTHHADLDEPYLDCETGELVNVDLIMEASPLGPHIESISMNLYEPLSRELPACFDSADRCLETAYVKSCHYSKESDILIITVVPVD